MSSRQLKILISELGMHIGEWLTIIRLDGAVIFVKLRTIDGNKLLCQNSLLKAKMILLTDIDEVWRDIKK
jgi:hypothetical protein|tara:strand:- start:13678 stop:13887 length:210 start_codon:yes stop_codon:yes gene_type:complete